MRTYEMERGPAQSFSSGLGKPPEDVWPEYLSKVRRILDWHGLLDGHDTMEGCFDFLLLIRT